MLHICTVEMQGAWGRRGKGLAVLSLMPGRLCITDNNVDGRLQYKSSHTSM